MASFTAAGTAYATHGQLMIPFFIFYSMFGFQRVGDLIWAFGDARGRGFLLGATAGRTTLMGEGLQHQDGHSPLLASTVPNCLVYDPAFAYEVAVIIRDGLRRMYEENEDVFYYLTLYNEQYVQPKMPRGADRRHPAWAVPVQEVHPAKGPRVQIIASGPIVWSRARGAGPILQAEYGVVADVWSATSFQQLRNDALVVRAVEPAAPRRDATDAVRHREARRHRGPVVAVTDYMKAVPDQIARWVREPYVSLGTDGFGRSDTREELRRHFEIDTPHIVAAALYSLAQAGEIKPESVKDAIEAGGIETERPDPLHA